MSMSTFKFTEKIDNADGGSLMIDRGTNLVAVRPKGRHRVYELELHVVAAMILERVVLAEHNEAKAETK